MSDRKVNLKYPNIHDFTSLYHTYVSRITGRNYGAGCYWSVSRYEAEIHDNSGNRRFVNRLYHPVKFKLTETEVCFWEFHTAVCHETDGKKCGENADLLDSYNADADARKMFYRGSGVKLFEMDSWGDIAGPAPMPANVAKQFALPFPVTYKRWNCSTHRC
jgi:hypothetical protein